MTTLTILIPTYNRSALAASLVTALARQMKPGEKRVDILISDNVSVGSHEATLRKLTKLHPNIKYHRHERHWPTGEQNLFEALPLCTGDFVWPLSDDDEPFPDSIERALSLLNETSHDVLLSNLCVEDQEGELIHSELVKVSGFPERMNFLELVRTFGLVTTGSCFSAIIMRREKLDVRKWKDWSSISPIYSHAFFFCETFAKSSCLFVQRPLIVYRQGGTGINAWERVARHTSKQLHFPWTIGLARLLRSARERNIFDEKFIHQVVELGVDGQFLLAQSMLLSLSEQLLQWVATKSARERISVDEFDEIADELVDGPPSMRLWIAELRKIVLLLSCLLDLGGSGALRYSLETDTTLESLLIFLPKSTVEQLRSSWLDILRQKLIAHKARLNVGLVSSDIPQYPAFWIIKFSGTFYAIPRHEKWVSGGAPQFFSAALKDCKELLSATSIGLIKELVVSTLEKQDFSARSVIGFDETYYLRQNPDVARKGGSCLQHYLTSGWHEGRNPSPFFNSVGYLQTNPDVKAAGINPLVHYYKHGAREGRAGW